jgi:hypothetical protein
MKNPIRYSILCGALLAAFPYTAAYADDSAASDTKSAPLGRKEAILITMTAQVEAIDLANRELTLKGPLGNSETLIADKRIKRLDEVKVGDLVQADYYISVAAELRKPTPEEEKTPLVVIEAEGKAPASESPAGGTLRRFKVVTTIEGLDRQTQTVKVKGPRGHYFTARVADPARLTQARIGDTIVIVYTEALAISIEKVAKKNSD